MNGTGTRSGMGWGARLLVGLALVLIGAASAVWGLAHYHQAARVLGVTPAPVPPVMLTPKPVVTNAARASAPSQGSDTRITALEERMSRVENAAERAAGSAGRADALVIAFAARRAIDRGVALGYLENLLAEQFGAQHPAAVATIITASRQPVLLNELIDQYQALGPEVRRGGPQDSWRSAVQRELGSLVEFHRADRPAANADARYSRALQRLETGDVDQALAETMRLPGVAHAEAWTGSARRYVAAHRALDEIESAALLPPPSGR